MTALVLDSAAMLVRARAAVGVWRVPQGQCLNFVWTVAGAVQSIPPALGHMDTAQHAWEAVAEADRHHGDLNPPPGVAVFFGPSPTRTDHNKDAGDTAVSIGNGECIATDVNGAYIGITTLAARGRAIDRPYNGWSNTLGGHTFSAALELVTAAQLIEAAKAQNGATIMSSRIIRVVSERPDGSWDDGFADPDNGGTWSPITDEAEAVFWNRSGVPRNTDVQARRVIRGFLNTQTGKRIA